MARRLRELRTTISIGDYSFDVITNRDILRASLINCPKMWEALKDGENAPTEVKDMSVDNAFFADDLDEFISDILPRMIKAAEANGEKKFKGTVDEFLDYCYDNCVLDTVEQKIFDFALLGFTDGKGGAENKPKLEVVMNY